MTKKQKTKHVPGHKSQTPRPHVISKVLNLLPQTLPPPSTFIPPKTLFLGEGDFTFTKSLHTSLKTCAIPTDFYCTSYESKSEVLVKYKQRAKDSLEYLDKQDGCKVRYNVDAMNLDKSEQLKGLKVRECVWVSASGVFCSSCLRVCVRVCLCVVLLLLFLLFPSFPPP